MQVIPYNIKNSWLELFVDYHEFVSIIDLSLNINNNNIPIYSIDTLCRYVGYNVILWIMIDG